MKVVSPDELPHRVRAVENLWIPMADGTRLAARMWIPESAEERPVPAVFEYKEYGVGLSETVLITDDGHEILTDCVPELHVVK